MKLSVVFRFLFLPLLLPLSFIFGLLVYFRRKLLKPNVKLNQKVISVGNIQVGGTGKTPIVDLLCRRYKDKAVVISRPYGASKASDEPKEVFKDSDPHEIGDEALALKRACPEARVFSGPVKAKTALFASQRVSNDSIFIVDDGAQHLKLFKDVNIIVWDMSRSFIDFLPFPFGFSREFWFVFIKNRIDVMNRFDSKKSQHFKKCFIPKATLTSDYKIKEIHNFNNIGSEIELVSGIGNFSQLKEQVQKFLLKNNKDLKNCRQGRDHDDFNWFKPQEGISYITTSKDFVKLSKITDPKRLYVVSSSFSTDFENRLISEIESF